MKTFSPPSFPHSLSHTHTPLVFFVSLASSPFPSFFPSGHARRSAPFRSLLHAHLPAQFSICSFLPFDSTPISLHAVSAVERKGKGGCRKWRETYDCRLSVEREGPILCSSCCCMTLTRLPHGPAFYSTRFSQKERSKQRCSSRHSDRAWS